MCREEGKVCGAASVVRGRFHSRRVGMTPGLPLGGREVDICRYRGAFGAVKAPQLSGKRAGGNTAGAGGGRGSGVELSSTAGMEAAAAPTKPVFCTPR